MIDKIINGIVYREGTNYYLISFYNEKRYEITDSFYSRYEEGNQPLHESCIVLVNWEEKSRHDYKTYPIMDYRVTFQDKPVKVSKLSLDTIIEQSYKVASVYIKNKKILSEDDSLI